MTDVERLGRATAAFLRAWRNGSIEQSKFRNHRRAISALCVAGITDSTYLFLFQTGTIRHLACPFFGSGCERISSSKTAHPFGIPDAIFGVAGYTALLAVTRMGSRARNQTQPLLPLLAHAGGTLAFGTSLYLTWRQRVEFHTFCFWCLTSAAISTAIYPLTWPEARAAWNTLQHRRPQAEQRV
jgi:uncharacterized membrane protein